MTLAVGFLSAAHVHTDDYAPLLAEHEDVDLVGITGPDADRCRDVAARHGTEYVPDHEDLLERIDAGVICSPNVEHRAWVERAAAAGVDVLCEKPLAPTVEDAQAIVDVWRESGITMGVAMPLRFSEPARRAGERLDAGEIGAVRTISGTNRGLMPGGWFVDEERSGGGAVMDHTVHIVDLVSHLLDADVAEVYAETGTRFHDLDVEDVNVLSMELADGTPFLLDGSWSKPDTWHTWGDATVELTGTEGTIAVDATDQSMVHTVASDADIGRGPETDAGVQMALYGADSNAGLIDDFVSAVREGREPATTPDEALAAVAVIEAAYESAERGEPVAVEY